MAVLARVAIVAAPLLMSACRLRMQSEEDPRSTSPPPPIPLRALNIPGQQNAMSDTNNSWPWVVCYLKASRISAVHPS